MCCARRGQARGRHGNCRRECERHWRPGLRSRRCTCSASLRVAAPVKRSSLVSRPWKVPPKALDEPRGPVAKLMNAQARLARPQRRQAGAHRRFKRVAPYAVHPVDLAALPERGGEPGAWCARCFFLLTRGSRLWGRVAEMAGRKRARVRLSRACSLGARSRDVPRKARADLRKRHRRPTLNHT